MGGIRSSALANNTQALFGDLRVMHATAARWRTKYRGASRRPTAGDIIIAIPVLSFPSALFFLALMRSFWVLYLSLKAGLEEGVGIYAHSRMKKSVGFSPAIESLIFTRYSHVFHFTSRLCFHTSQLKPTLSLA